jgi:hypothetical protein
LGGTLDAAFAVLRDFDARRRKGGASVLMHRSVVVQDGRVGLDVGRPRPGLRLDASCCTSVRQSARRPASAVKPFTALSKLQCRPSANKKFANLRRPGK